VKLTVMFSPMKKAKPLESNINIILGVLGALNFLKGHLSQILDPTFHEKLHGVFLKLHLFLRADAPSVLFLQNPVPISLLHSRLQPGSLHRLWGSRSRRGRGTEQCLGARGGAAWRGQKTNSKRRHGKERVSRMSWSYCNGGLREEFAFL